MGTSIVYWGYIGIMEEKMETTGIIGVILRICSCLRTGPNSDPPGTQVSVAFEGLGKIAVRLLRANFWTDLQALSKNLSGCSFQKVPLVMYSIHNTRDRWHV